MRNVLGQFANLSADTRTREVLSDWFRMKYAGRHITSNAELTLALLVNGRRCSLTCPGNALSLELFYSIFVEAEYYMPHSVDRIYDLGANIGMSAVYFHSLYPSAEIVCVEPSAQNTRLLRKNLSANNVPSIVIEGAISNCSGRKPLYEYPDAFVSHSLFDKKTALRSTRCMTTLVDVLRFDEIIDTKESYGLKVDIEGCEHYMADFPEIVNRASWIVGELHDGSFLDGLTSDRLTKALHARFNVVELSRPRLVDDRTNIQFRAEAPKAWPPEE